MRPDPSRSPNQMPEYTAGMAAGGPGSALPPNSPVRLTHAPSIALPAEWCEVYKIPQTDHRVPLRRALPLLLLLLHVLAAQAKAVHTPA